MSTHSHTGTLVTTHLSNPILADQLCDLPHDLFGSLHTSRLQVGQDGSQPMKGSHQRILEDTRTQNQCILSRETSDALTGSSAVALHVKSSDRTSLPYQDFVLTPTVIRSSIPPRTDTISADQLRVPACLPCTCGCDSSANPAFSILNR